jgi:hypothetical protein
MSKEKKEDTTEWKFNGNEGDWENFDRRVTRYMRKKYDQIGESMWLGEIGSIFQMNQGDFDLHCSNVMKAIYCSDPSEARKLKLDMAEFEDADWQHDWITRQYTLLGDFLESHFTGQAEIEMINYVGEMRNLRKHLYKQFGSGSGGDIHDKELEFDRGMPEKGKAAFPNGCDMGEKAATVGVKEVILLEDGWVNGE